MRTYIDPVRGISREGQGDAPPTGERGGEVGGRGSVRRLGGSVLAMLLLSTLTSATAPPVSKVTHLR